MASDNVREQSFERPLPHSSEAEASLLGEVLLDNHLLNETIERLKLEEFYVPSHRRIFGAMMALFEKGSEVNPILIGEELKKENALESVGGVTFITNLTYGLVPARSIDGYITVIKNKALLRRMVKVASKITMSCLEEEDETPIIIEQSQQAVFEVGSELERGKLVWVGDAASDLLEKIQGVDKQGAVTGIPTGLVDLDELTTGWQKSDLIIVAARPSQGKTSFATLCAQNAAIRYNCAVAVFTLEMSQEQIVGRMICSEANVDYRRFKRGFLSKQEWALIAKALGSFHNSKLYVDQTPGLTTLELRSRARRFFAEQKQLDLIVVDYLQLMAAVQGRRRSESRQQEVSQISRELKQIAKELNVPMLVVSALSRGPEARAGHRPQLADLRESGGIEYDADMVMFVHRHETYLSKREREELPDDKRNVAQIIVAKQRNGPTDDVEMRWIPSSMRFDNLYRGDDDADRLRSDKGIID